MWTACWCEPGPEPDNRSSPLSGFFEREGDINQCSDIRPETKVHLVYAYTLFGSFTWPKHLLDTLRF